MKKTLAAIIIGLAAVAVIVLLASKEITRLQEDGFAVPSSAAIDRELATGDEQLIDLVKVSYDEAVYSSVMGYYVGNRKKAIDKTFPIYTNGGATLRFINEENQLITPEVNIVSTFDGLYLSDGRTFNSDLSRCDADEFILLALSNGLYMNAQFAHLDNASGSHDIKDNSILLFREDELDWYEFKDEGALLFKQETDVRDATITIGDHTYKYKKLLDAIGLLDEIIDRKKKGADTEALEDEAAQILEDSDDYYEEETTPEQDAKQITYLNPKTLLNAGQGALLPEETGKTMIPDGEQTKGGSRTSSNTSGSGSRDTTSGESGSGSRGSIEKGSSSNKRQDQSTIANPEISFNINNDDIWVYALSGTVNIYDPYSTLKSDVRISAFENYSEGTLANRVSSAKTKVSNDFILSMLKPDTDYYICTEYTYLKNGQTPISVISDPVKVHTAKTDILSPVSANWLTDFAAYTNAFRLSELKVKNTTDYSPESDSFDNYQKDVLSHVARIEYKVEMQSASKNADESAFFSIEGTDLQDIINDSKVDKGTTYISDFGKMKSNSKYKLTVTGYDAFENRIPFVIGTDEISDKVYNEFVYTSKEAPTAKLRGKVNKYSTQSGIKYTLSLDAQIEDLDDALTGESAMLVINGPGIDNKTFKLDEPKNGKIYKNLLIENVQKGEEYEAVLSSNMNMTPDAAAYANGLEFLPTEKGILAKRDFTIKISGGGGDDPKEYATPSVTFSTRLWCYAMEVSTTIDDPDGAIQGKVGVTLYSDSACKVVAGSAVFDSTGAATIEGLRPNKDYYYKYQYSYYQKDKIIRINSEPEKIHTLSVETASVSQVSGYWDLEFAAYKDAASFTGVEFRNTTDYEPDNHEYDNIIKDTLSHISRIEYCFTPKNNASASQAFYEISGSILETAKASSAFFITENEILEPNTQYEISAVAYDKYGFWLPLNYDDSEKILYTRKASPEATLPGLAAADEEASSSQAKYEKIEKPDLYVSMVDSRGIRIRFSLSDEFKAISKNLTARMYYVDAFDEKVYVDIENPTPVKDPKDPAKQKKTASGALIYDSYAWNLKYDTPYTVEIVAEYDLAPTGSGKHIYVEEIIGTHTYIISESQSGGGSGEPSPYPGIDDDDEPEYREPNIYYNWIEPWSYVVGTDLAVIDLAKRLSGSVTLTAYSTISKKKDAPVATVSVADSKGVEHEYYLYPARTESDEVAYVGSGVMARASGGKSMEFNLATVKPDTDLYLQYSYKFKAREAHEEQKIDKDGKPVYDSHGNPVMETVYTVKRKTVVSPLIKVHTEAYSETEGEPGYVRPAELTWNTLFANNSNGIELEALLATNTSASYRANDNSLENLKLHTLKYINSFEFSFEPLNGGETIVKKTSNNQTLNTWSTGTGINYTATDNLFKSNSGYKMTVRALDKFGNPISLQVNKTGMDVPKSYTAYFENVYTAKKTPSASVIEKSKTVGEYNMTVGLTDTDNALLYFDEGQDNFVKLQVLDGSVNRDPVVLSGQVEYTDPDGNEKTRILHNETEAFLPKAKEGTLYRIKLTSLPYSELFTAVVTGKYNTTPDAASDEDRLDDIINPIGSLEFYSAAMTSEKISVTTNVTSITDGSAVISYTMNTKSNPVAMRLADQIDLYLKNGENVRLIYSLEKDKINSLEGYATGEISDSFIVQKMTTTLPEIKICGSGAAVDKLWESLIPIQMGQNEYADPTMHIEISYPEDDPKVLRSLTKYELVIAAYTHAGGKSYDVNSELSGTTTFTTLRKTPYIEKDILVTNNKIFINDLRVIDPDGAIRAEGKVNVTIYRNDDPDHPQVVGTNHVIAVAEDGGPGTGKKIEFTGIFEDVPYLIVITASSYNNSPEGGTNRVKDLDKWNVTGGGSLGGSLDLISIDTTAYRKSFTPYTEYTAENKAESTQVVSLADLAKELTNNEEISFIEIIDNEVGVTRTHSVNFYANASKGSAVKIEHKSDRDGHNGIYKVPNGKTHFALALDTIGEEGVQVRVYKKTEDNSVNIGNGKNITNLRVQPGEVYVANSTNVQKITVACYSKGNGTAAGRDMGSITVNSNEPIVIPDDTYSINVSYTNTDSKYLTGFYRLSPVTGDGYTATLRVKVKDTQGYLAEQAGGADRVYAEIMLDAADNKDYPKYYHYNEGQFKDGNLKVKLELKDEETNEYEGIAYLDNLPEDHAWYATLKLEFLGDILDLDNTEFATDGQYILIHNNRELENAVARNPRGKFLVVEDFIHDRQISKFYGTIDFQGHTITRKSGITSAIFDANYGTIKNLAYDFEESDTAINFVNKRIVNGNFGTIDGIIIRTHSPLKATYGANEAQAFFDYNQNGAVIRNFVVELNGDVNYTYTGSNTARGLVLNYNYGTLENGYVYMTENYAMYFAVSDIKKYPTSPRFGVLGYECNYTGVVRNIYEILDMHMSANFGANMISSGVNFSTGPVKNIYRVGDDFVYEEAKWIPEYNDPEDPTKKTGEHKDPDWVKEETLKTSVESIYCERRYSTNTVNLQHVTDAKYADKSGVLRSQRVSLERPDWQKKILDESTFNIDENLELNYYPRLILSEELNKKQPYIKLPNAYASAEPQLLYDKWADTGHYVKNRSVNYGHGNITLGFYNPEKYPINQVEMKNLTIIGKPNQKNLDDGISEITLEVDIDDSVGDQYLSAYEVTGITYNNRTYKNISYTTTNIEFWKGIYGPVTTVENGVTRFGWNEIDKHKDWNYRLMNDINFYGVSDTDMRIYEKLGTSKTDVFTGKIDGGIYGNITNGNYDRTGLYTMYNMEIVGEAGNTRPVIFHAVENAVIENLVIDNLKLKTALTNSCGGDGRTGFIGELRRNSKVDNVHIKGGSIIGSGCTGAIVAYYVCDNTNYPKQEAAITNCSVSGVTFGDVHVSNNSYFGGILGWGYGVNISNSYVYDINMSVNQLSSLKGLGGIAGYIRYGNISDCYAHGTVNATGNNIGGILGLLGTSVIINNNWSYVNMDIIGNYVGAIVGREESVERAHIRNNLGIGAILCTGNYVGRIFGNKITGNTILEHNYAYSGQYISDVKFDDTVEVSRYFSADELRNPSIWINTMGYSKYWDYRNLQGEDGKFPWVYRDDFEDYKVNDEITDNCLVYGQKGGTGQSSVAIAIPSQSGNNTLSITHATHYEMGTEAGSIIEGQPYYEVEMTIHHEGYTSEEFEALRKQYRDGHPLLQITVDGLDTDLSAEFTFSKIGTDPYASAVRFRTIKYTAATDTYLLSVNYPDKTGYPVNMYEELAFKDPAGNAYTTYWRVYNINETDAEDMYNGKYGWTYLLKQGHGKTNENFMICDQLNKDGAEFVIDAAANPEQTSLKIGRIEGEKPGYGFYNVKFVTDSQGSAWVDVISKTYKQITLGNFNAYLSGGNIKSNRAKTSLIQTVQEVKNCGFENITMTTNTYTTGTSGVLGEILFGVDGVTVDRLTRTREGATTTEKEKAGGLIYSVSGHTYNVKAKNVTVNLPNTKNVGGILYSITKSGTYGYNKFDESGYTGNSSEYTFENITVNASTNVGGIVCSGSAEYATARGIKVTASGTSAGGFIGTGSYRLDYLTLVGDAEHETVIESKGSGGNTGGIAVDTSAYGRGNIRVQGITVKANGTVGGIAGSFNSNSDSKNLTVIDTTIINSSTSGSTGGIVGALTDYTNAANEKLVVRNTTITGPSNVGGVVGSCGSYPQLKNVYVAEDVYVTARSGGNCGGIVGQVHAKTSTTTPMISFTACGATVRASGDNAGGIAGYVYYSGVSSLSKLIMNQVYYRGSVSGNDYIAGLVGKYTNETVYTANKITHHDRYHVDPALVRGIIIAGSFTGLGDHAAADVNSLYEGEELPQSEGSIEYAWKDTLKHGDMHGAIWDQTVVNGKAAFRMAGGYGRYQSPQLWTSDDFRTKEKYQSLGYTDTSWTLFDEFDKYMPYTKYNSEIMPYTSRNSQGQEAGILLPEYGENKDTPSVYASGIDTVTIEIPKTAGIIEDERLASDSEERVLYDSIDVIIKEPDGTPRYEYTGSSALQPDANGVVSLKYNFQDTIVVGSKEYTPEMLRNTLAVTGNKYIYTDNKDDTKLEFSKGLETAYQPVEYIESTGKEYIDTGVIQTIYTTVDLDVENKTKSDNYLYGGKQNSVNMMYNGIYNSTIEYNYQSVSFDPADRVVMTQQLTDDHSQIVVTINDVDKTLYLGDQADATSIYFFAARKNNGDLRLYNKAVKLYSLVIKEDGVVVRDYMPVYDTVNKVYGLYDKVTCRFYGNLGTGAFKGGPVAEHEEKSKDPVSAGGSIVHIWNDELLVDTGSGLQIKKVTFNDSDDAELVSEGAFSYGTIPLLEKAKPFFIKTASDSSAIYNVFKTFTIEHIGDDDVRREFREYVFGGADGEEYIYSVPPILNMLTDQVIIDKVKMVTPGKPETPENVSYENRVALWEEEGALAANFKLPGTSRTIKEISNTLWKTPGYHYMLIRYNDGSVAIYDYANEMLVGYNDVPTPPKMSLFSYAMNSLGSAVNTLGGVFGNGSGDSENEPLLMTSLGNGIVSLSMASAPQEETTAASSIYVENDGLYDMNGDLLASENDLEHTDKGIKLDDKLIAVDSMKSVEDLDQNKQDDVMVMKTVSKLMKSSAPKMTGSAVAEAESIVEKVAEEDSVAEKTASIGSIGNETDGINNSGGSAEGDGYTVSAEQFETPLAVASSAGEDDGEAGMDFGEDDYEDDAEGTGKINVQIESVDSVDSEISDDSDSDNISGPGSAAETIRLMVTPDERKSQEDAYAKAGRRPLTPGEASALAVAMVDSDEAVTASDILTGNEKALTADYQQPNPGTEKTALNGNVPEEYDGNGNLVLAQQTHRNLTGTDESGMRLILIVIMLGAGILVAVYFGFIRKKK